MTWLSLLTRIIILVMWVVLGSGCRSVSTLRAWWGNEPTDNAIVPLTLVQGSSIDAGSQPIESIIDDFGQINDAITVTLRIEDNYSTFLTRDNFADADLVQIDSFLLPDLIAQNVVQPLPPSFLQDGLTRLDDFYPALRNAFTVNGNLYCLPYEFRTLALVYNKALFDEAQIDYPNAEWTWTDFSAAATAISESTNVFYTTYGLALSADASRWLPFLYQNGGGLLASDRQTTVIDSPEAIEAMTFYLGFIEEGIAATNSTFLSGWSGEAFATGRVGMVIEGNWIVPYLESEFPDLDFGIAPLPAGRAGLATVTFSSCYAVAAQTENLPEALTFLRHLNSPAAMRTLDQGNASAPSRLSLQSEWLQQNGQMSLFLTAIEYARPWRFKPDYQLVIDSISSNMQRAIEAEIPAEEILRVANELSNQPATR